MFIRFGATHERDRRTDGRTPHADIGLYISLNCCWQRIFNEKANYFQMFRLGILSAILPESFK